MDTSARQWDQNAPSLLWAYELRRENVLLAEQVHKIKADLSLTTDTIDTLKQSIDDASKRVDKETCETWKTIESRTDERHTSLVNRIEILEAENVRLKDNLETVRRECDMQAKELTCFVESMASMKSEVMDEMRRLIRESNAVRVYELKTRERGIELASDVLVPDSMPKNDGTTSKDDPLRTLSETTLGPSSPPGGQYDNPPERTSREQPGVVRWLFEQGGRSLDEYLAYASTIRAQHPLGDTTREFITAFVQGIDDSNTRALIEKQLDKDGWTWDALVGIIGNSAGRCFQTVKSHPSRVPGAVSRVSPKDHPIIYRKKKRRLIPIVPLDEDDLLTWP